MASTQGYENIILPSLFGNPGQTLERAIDRKRDDYQFEQQMSERRSEREYGRQQNNRLYNLREIDADTDPSKYRTGQQAIDDYTIGELKGIKDKALQNYINLDPAEMEYRLTQDMNDLVGWHQSIKDDYTKMNQGLTQFAKDNPNVDVNKAYDFAMNELGKKYMAGNENGYSRVPAERIQHSVDPLSVLNDPSVLGFITNDVKPFQDYIQGLKLQSVGGSEYKSKKGYAKGFKYSGGVSPISEMTFDEDGRPSGTKVKSETLDIGGGRKLEMLPEDEFKNIMNIPAARNSLLKMWNDEKMSKGIGKLDAPTEERLFRDYARKQYEKYDASYIKEDEKDIVPRPPQVNIYNQAQQSPAAQWVENMYNAAASGDDKNVKAMASQLFSGLGKDEFMSDKETPIYLSGDQTGTGTPAIQFNFKGKIKSKKGKEIEGNDYERIYLDDPAIKTKLAGIYQKLMSPEKKVEDANFYLNQKPITNQPTKKTTTATTTTKKKISGF